VNMQRVTNCILIDNDHILLLKKPSRGWYAIPGGKMERGETIKESVMREYREETALHIESPQLAGVFTFNIFKEEQPVQEWMMFTFVSYHYHGLLTDFCEEGELEWVRMDDIENYPMAAGDQKIFEHIRSSSSILYGAFSYTEDYDLLDYRFDLGGPEEE